MPQERLAPSPPWYEVFSQDVSAACSLWPAANHHESGEIGTLPQPVLAFTGALDPITPPAVLETLPLADAVSLRLVVEYGGHASNFHCMAETVAAFLSGQRAEALQGLQCAVPLARYALDVGAKTP